MTDASEEGTFEIEVTDEAFLSYASIPSERVFSHVEADIGLLGTTPFLGREYDPVYEAARPDFPCRVLYCEYYGIYYRVDEAIRRVIVFAIEDQRRNPANRFTSYDYATASFDPVRNSCAHESREGGKSVDSGI